MTIEEAVSYYNNKKGTIKKVDSLIRALTERSTFDMPGQMTVRETDAHEIVLMLMEYKGRLKKDLKEEFKLSEDELMCINQQNMHVKEGAKANETQRGAAEQD